MHLHIAHANGFPGSVYQPLASRLNADCIALPKIGHNPAYAVENEWDLLAQELIAFIDKSAPGEKFFLVGHSLGAIVSFRVAHSRPDLVSGLVMLDPPLIFGFSSWPVRIARLLGKMDEITPARLSKRRKRRWQSLQEAEAYFRGKPFYAQLHPEVLSAWLSSALVNNNGEIELAFNVDVEVDIFRTTPLYLSRLKGRLCVPAWLRYASDSDATFRHCVEPFAQCFGVSLSVTTGGHMFPLRALDETADFINRCIKEVVA